MQDKIYLDNAATTFPKAPGVKEAMCEFLENIGASAGRSGHSSSIQSGRILFESRLLLARLFGLKDSKRIFFTLNATMAINTLLFGFLKSGDVVVTSQLEHNAIKRPLNELKKRRKIIIKEIPCDEFHRLDLSVANELLKDAKLLAIAHSNNVSGAVIPLEALSGIAKKNGVKILLDAAQSAGCVDLSGILELVDFIALSAHKGLLAPMGVGALVVADSFEINQISPLVFGGTGSRSEEEIQPLFLPDKFESGTQNMHGIAGLKAALEWILQKGVLNIHKYELNLRQQLLEGLRSVRNLKVYETFGDSNANLSIDLLNYSLSNVARLLDGRGILVRVGLHCNPSSHRSLGSFMRGGTIRLSPGVFNTESQMEFVIKELRRLAKGR